MGHPSPLIPPAILPDVTPIKPNSVRGAIVAAPLGGNAEKGSEGDGGGTSQLCTVCVRYMEYVRSLLDMFPPRDLDLDLFQ